MLLKFKTPHADDVATWINPEHVAGIHAAAPDVATIYLVGGFEQRVAGRAEDIARQVDAAQRQSGALSGRSSASGAGPVPE